jgi:hypothetical protein
VQDHFAGRIAENYDRDLPASFTPEVLNPCVEKLIVLAAGGACLEFAIGTGRVALPMHKLGLHVEGIEFSPDMVSALRRKPGGNELRVEIGDMATFNMGRTYKLVFLVFNTIMNLTTQREQIACFQNAAHHLDAGGKFVVEVMVPDLRRFPPGAVAVPFDVSPAHLGFDTYAVAEQMLWSHHVTIDPDGAAKTHVHPFRYVWPSELDLMAEIAGFTLVSRHADWNGEPFENDSRQHVSVWQKN